MCESFFISFLLIFKYVVSSNKTTKKVVFFFQYNSEFKVISIEIEQIYICQVHIDWKKFKGKKITCELNDKNVNYACVHSKPIYKTEIFTWIGKRCLSVDRPNVDILWHNKCANVLLPVSLSLSQTHSNDCNDVQQKSFKLN